MSEFTKRFPRKNHKCSLCQRTIFKGHKYIHCKITPWDHPDNDSFGVYKAHLFCHYYFYETGIGEEWDYYLPGEHGEGSEFIARVVYSDDGEWNFVDLEAKDLVRHD